MTGDVLTTWGIVLDRDPGTGGEGGTSAAALFAEGRRACFDRCPRLVSFLRAEDAQLRPAAEHFDVIDDAALTGGITVAVSVVEVHPSSFTMAVRIRTAGEDAVRPANGRCTLVIERRMTGERVPIPREVRDEFVAIQLGAPELC